MDKNQKTEEISASMAEEGGRNVEQTSETPSPGAHLECAGCLKARHKDEMPPSQRGSGEDLECPGCVKARTGLQQHQDAVEPVGNLQQDDTTK